MAVYRAPNLAIVYIRNSLITGLVFCQFAAAQTTSSLSCAAFYPNIGQTELFFAVTGDSPNTSGLTLMQNGNSINPTEVRQIGNTIGGVSILKATLIDEITGKADITATYKPQENTSDDDAIIAACEPSLSADSDADGLADIIDSAPFDASISTTNTDIASIAPLAVAPREADAFYSRDVVVRNLLCHGDDSRTSASPSQCRPAGGEFSYIEEIGSDELVKKTFSAAMPVATYFGIESTKARVFRVDESCRRVLDAARDYHLSKVKINEHCTDVTDDFANETVGSRFYVWAEVEEGLLVASDYRSYELRVLPDINFAGQVSYLYDKPTTRSVVVSAYVGSSTQSVTVSVRGLSETTAVELTAESNVPASGDESGIIDGFYYPTSEGRHPSAGETVTRWLDGSAQIWQPTSDTLVARAGGYPEFGDMRYAIGTTNYVDVKTADESEAITRINTILLYDISSPSIQRVSSMIAGRSYYVVADLTTNDTDIGEQVSAATQWVDGYRIITTITEVINEVRTAGHLIDAEYIEIIGLEVDDTNTTRTITVGWNNIGAVEDIRATYVVTATPPVPYGASDDDNDRIPNNYDVYPDNPQTLQVAVADTIRPTIDYLTSQRLYPLFISDTGMIKVLGAGGDTREDYSVANIAYADIDAETKTLLGISDEDGLVVRIATFGIGGVDYAVGGEGEVAGGITYSFFPLEWSADEVLYMGVYNREAKRWERFGRGDIAGYTDSWYAIEAYDNEMACPTDIQKYKSEHKLSGDGMGFSASEHNCIMLAISDGGPYDDSSLDGRVVALSGLSAMPFSFDRVFPPRPIITVVAMDDRRAVISNATQTHVTYGMRFEVFAGGDASGLTDPNSYSLLRIRQDGEQSVVETTASVVSATGKPNAVIVTYADVRLETTMIGETSGFTLARNGTSLQSADFQDPIRDSSGEVIAPGMRLDVDVEAVADTVPYITAIDDFKLVPTNEGYVLPVVVTDNTGNDIRVSMVSDNSGVISTTPTHIDIASGGEFTNTVHFELAQPAEGRAAVTIYAADGTTTGTQVFEVEVGNEAPVIEGIGAEETKDVFFQLPEILNFRVYDADRGSAKNEDVTVEFMYNRVSSNARLNIEGNLDDGYILRISPTNVGTNILTILVTDNAGVQTKSVLTVNAIPVDFVRGRYAGQPTDLISDYQGDLGCIRCNPRLDGIVRMRFVPDATELSNENGKDFIEFSVELSRKNIFDNSPRYLLVNSSIIKYNAEAFGASLNFPPLISAMDTPGTRPQCTYERSLPSVFDGKDYGIIFFDASINMLTIFQPSVYINFGGISIPTYQEILSTSEGLGDIDPELLSVLGADWKRLITMKCEIPQGRAANEAGIALSLGELVSTILRDYRQVSVISDRHSLVLADNDLRGFRLDGKTYAEDYARYGDGRGVRIKFSEGIATQLTTQHFVVRFADDSDTAVAPQVTAVSHTPNSAYTNVLISDAVADAELRLISSGTTVINDIDGNALADGNFVAALEYDAAAPQATTMTRVSFVDGISTWHIGFSAPLHAVTVSTATLCITDADGLCSQIGQPTTPSIVSASLIGNTTITVVIDEVGSKANAAHSIEFRRNAVLGEDFRIVEDYQPMLRAAMTTADRLGIACAAFYPNIGQNELFVRITRDADDVVNPSGLSLMQNGNPLVAEVMQIGETVREISLFKVMLSDEITSDADIVAMYRPQADTPDDEVDTTVCPLSLAADSDADGLADIIDNAPYDASISTTNTDIASTAPLAVAPSESDAFYSRDVVVRNLLCRDSGERTLDPTSACRFLGGAFNYIELKSGTPVKRTFGAAMAMSAATYFGIEDARARVFRADESCRRVLDAARDYHLSKVKINEHCTDVTDDFANEAVGSRNYVWAEVEEGILVASDYRNYELRVLPEINFSGQSSYLYDEPTTNVVVISAYVGSSTQSVTVSVRSLSEMVDVELLTVNQSTPTSSDGMIISGFYYPTSERRHPSAGGTVTRWLDGSAQIWRPANGMLTARAGGYPEFSDMRYAIGTTSYVDVGVADARESVTRINHILLYDISGETVQRVSSLVAGRLYYVVADLTTNDADIGERVSVATQLADGYRIITTITEVVNEVRTDGRLVDAEYIEIIAVEVDDTNTTRTITVGWDRIGDLENIKTNCLVTAMPPLPYGAADSDGDHIPDLYDLRPADPTELQVAIGGSVGGVNRLKTDASEPLFLSDAGLITAIVKGGDDSADYSAANIAYVDLSDDNKALLGLSDTDTSIERIATFGVGEVDYAVGNEGAAIGGVSYTVFPMASLSVDKTLYMNIYDSEAQRWKRFGRGAVAGYVDTWYAIERPDDSVACPLNIQKYKNEHRAAGDKGMGFTAGAENCIMLAMSDGGPYDGSSVDGRVIALSGLSTTLTNTGPYIAAIDNFRLLQTNKAYTLPIAVTDNEGDDVRVSIVSSNSDVVSVVATAMRITSYAGIANTVNFELTPTGIGNAPITVYASDGISTSTQAFEISVVPNVAPTIEGIAAEETKTIFSRAPVVINFRVSDANIGSEKNENITVKIRASGGGAATDLQGNLSDGYRLKITGTSSGAKTITVSVTDNAGAEANSILNLNVLTVPFIKSRFTERFNLSGCSGCDPISDGITHIRFAPDSVKLLNEAGKNFIEFALQLRRTNSTDSPRYFLVFNTGFNYKTSVFGTNLNIPPILSARNTLNPEAQCAYRLTSENLFAGKSYNLGFSDVLPYRLNISRIAASGIGFTSSENVSALGADWKELIVMKCEIPQGLSDNEAGISINSGERPTAYLAEYVRSDAMVLRRPLVFSDNDLRGFRLDGKTYAEDYARYGDGRGVRVKFSKGIATQLTTQHFVVAAADLSNIADVLPTTQDSVVGSIDESNIGVLPQIIVVVHTPNSAYANVLISDAIAGAELRLISTGTTVINDIDGNALADGNFVAALEYDAAAPQATTMTRVAFADGMSTWDIGFSAPIHAASVDTANLCITDADGLCSQPGQPTTPSIVSASLAGNTTITVVIDEVGSKAGATHSVEFRRNAVLGEDFRIVEDYQPMLRAAVTTADRFGVACAAFYPNIGQNELFVEITSDADNAINPSGLSLMQNGNPLVAEVMQIGETVREVSLLKAMLGDEITSDADIVAMYRAQADTPEDEVDSTVCPLSLAADSDTDGLADIIDSAPFDASISTTNTNIASIAPLATAPRESDVFYSRDVVVRNLLCHGDDSRTSESPSQCRPAGGEFSYIEEIGADELVKKTFSAAMPVAAYFGIESTKARVFRVDKSCRQILDAARDYHLTEVKIADYCTDVTDDFANETIGSRLYVWAEVEQGLLVASDYRSYEVRVLPDINFAGQVSYLYDKPTTRSVVVSAHVGSSTQSVTVSVRGLSETMAVALAAENNVPASGNESGIIDGFYYPTSEGRHPSAGETVTRWLDGSAQIWRPTSDTSVARAGGYPEFGDMRYAIGTTNYVDVKVADESEAITRINTILLYDISSPSVRRVSSMVAGRPYYVVADLTTNDTDISEQISAATQWVDGYRIITTITEVINEVRTAGHLVDAEYIEIIGLEVNDTNTTRTITVGWNNIGAVEDIRATYVVTATPPVPYGASDDDNDRIPNNYDVYPDNPQTLQVAVADTIRPAIDYLTSQRLYPLFISDTGMIKVLGAGGDTREDYSVANIAYADIDAETKTLLGISDEGGLVVRIATFGIGGVDYAVGGDGEVAGGITYSFFPLEWSADEVLYMGVYNREAKRWERFGRGDIAGYTDSWYAIEAYDNEMACPTDIQKYKSEHKLSGDGMGFSASEHNCIMLAISDGGPYDDSSLDGRVVALSGLSAVPFSFDRVFPPRPIITVVAMDDRRAVISNATQTHVTYGMRFEVFAGGDASGLTDPNSYSLLRIRQDGGQSVVETTASVVSATGKPNTVIVTYADVRLETTMIGETSGFTLARNGMSLQNADFQDPIRDSSGEVIAPGMRLDVDVEAVADTVPYITAIDDFKLVPTNEGYVLPVVVTDNTGNDIRVSMVSDNSGVISTTPTHIDIASGGEFTNTVHFELAQPAEGRAAVTIYAADGTTTGTQVFEVEVGNEAPVIEGIGAEETKDVFFQLPEILNFRVYDADRGSAKNEDVTVEFIYDRESRNARLNIEGNLDDGYILRIRPTNVGTNILTILVTDNAGAQTKSVLTVNAIPVDFVRGRYAGQPNDIISGYEGDLGCIICNPRLDGIVRMRFVPDATELSNENGKDFIEFSVELSRRNVPDNSPRYLLVDGSMIKYNAEAFGPSLNFPPLASAMDTPGTRPQCTYERSSPSVFDGKDYGIIFFDVSTNLLAIFQPSAYINTGGISIPTHQTYQKILSTSEGLGNIDPELLSVLGTGWKRLITMKCEIPQGRAANEAGIALGIGELVATILRDYRQVSISSDRHSLVLADNDLRGFRLDGKTYAQDYARYGDGRGVRIKFSKGIATQLTTQHFVVRFADDSDTAVAPQVIAVAHTPNSAYANVLIGDAIAGAELRLISSGTTVINDIDGNALADGNFVAALEYDAVAPQATTMTRVAFADGLSTWHIGFSAPIHAVTVSTATLCITNENNVCSRLGQPTTPSIVSASLVGNTTITVVIDEVGSKAGATHSVEFRRNAVLGEDFRIVEDYQPMLRDAVTMTDRFGMACAAFYPNIGQNELFVEITSDADNAINPSGLTLMQNGNLLVAEVMQIGETVREVSLLKAMLGDEITSDADIVAMYRAQADTPDDEVDSTVCALSLAADSDTDGLADIIDSAPFDASISTTNTDIASTAPLAVAPREADVFYSRDVVVRNLLCGGDDSRTSASPSQCRPAGGEFSYIQEIGSDELVKKTFNAAMSAATYFGIESTKARVFRVDGSCRQILDAARDYHLSKVKIADYCMDVTNDFANEAIGSRLYVWAEVEQGLLVASDYRSYEVRVLPDINFLGQVSYLYDKPTTRSVVVSAYVGSSTQSVTVSVRGLSETTAVALTAENNVPLLGDKSGIIDGFYYPTGEGRHPSAGETVTRWLDGSAQIWRPTSDTLVARAGGYPEFGDMRYAIGTTNYVDVKVVDESEAITRINTILLYDISNSPLVHRVSSMVAGRPYYVVADLTTNDTDIGEQVSVAMQWVDGYRIITTITQVINEVRTAGHLIDAEYIEIIAVEVDDTNTTRTIDVGWNNIGAVEDIRATYVVTATPPALYGASDDDNDRIPNSYDVYPDNPQTLQVAVADTISPTIDYLTSQRLYPLFISDAGMIKVLGAGGSDRADYSVANIAYADIDAETKMLLGINDEDSMVARIATFGIGGVDYAIGSGGEVAGGITYSVFPLEWSAGEVLYVGTYNSEAGRWERLERGSGGDAESWYAVERQAGTACSGRLEKYQREHRGGGDDGMGFIASEQNCIMLAIRDGGRYDDSSLDGRVIAMGGLSAMPFRLSTAPLIATIDDIKLLATRLSYTVPVAVRVDNEADLTVSLVSDDDAVVATTPTTVSSASGAGTMRIANFGLTPQRIGDAVLKVYASDGASTDTETFKVAVAANTAPTIGGIDALETTSVLVGQSIMLNFRVNDADIESAANEALNVAVAAKHDVLVGWTLEEYPDYNFRLSVSGEVEGNEKMTITATDSSGASTQRIVIVQVRTAPSTDRFVQSRFLGGPTNVVCAACRIAADGIAHIRFQPNRTNLIGTDDKNYVEFTLQLQRADGLGMDLDYLSSVGFALDYDTTVFGDDLNDPALSEDGSGGSQCSYVRKDLFTATGKSYSLSFSDDPGGELMVTERNDYFENLDSGEAGAALFSLLTADWQDVITLRCEIPSGREVAEAGIAISGRYPRSIINRKYPSIGEALQRPMFLIADNDLRGFRLDGKTYAQDYARYGDGRGVRIKFSKGIATQLTTQHFVVRFADDSDTAVAPQVIAVAHTPNSAYANVLIGDAIAGAELRLISSGTTVINDIDGNALADGNFVAALEYDAAAPQATTMTRVAFADGLSTWHIGFSAPIYAASVDAANLCITDADGLCSQPGQPTTPSIVSASLVGNTTITVVIDEVGSKIGATHSVEFRRNAVLGEDFRIVEDYQPMLRDKIIITDIIPPTITVVAKNNGEAVVTEDSHTHITYKVGFKVSASEPVIGLDAPSSYRLLRMSRNDDVEIVEAVPTVERIPEQMNAVSVSFTGVRLEVNIVKETSGFTLGRSNSNSMDDLAGNNPVGMSDGDGGVEPLDSKGVQNAKAMAMTSDPSSNARLIELMLSEGVLMPDFSSATVAYNTEISNATTRIAVTLRVAHSGAMVTVNGKEVTNEMPSRIIEIGDEITTTVRITVIAQDGTSMPYTVEITRGPSVIRIRTKVFLEGVMD